MHTDRSIDEAQGLRAGEYQPTTNAVIRALSWGNRITQDLRFVGQEQHADEHYRARPVLCAAHVP